MEYFRTFQDMLGPHMLAFFAEAIGEGRFPRETNLATIVVLPKPGHRRSVEPHIGPFY